MKITFSKRAPRMRGVISCAWAIHPLSALPYVDPHFTIKTPFTPVTSYQLPVTWKPETGN